jgi:hypothetical protein
MSANRLDGCGRCDLLPTTTGWVRATQVRCPVHGSRPDALPADPTPTLRTFEGLLADPHEQFDRDGELLRSVVDWTNAPSSTASCVPRPNRSVTVPTEPTPAPGPPIEVLRAARDWAAEHHHQIPDDRLTEIAFAAGVAAGRTAAAAAIREAPYPDPSPCIPAWHAGYTEATEAAARIAEGTERDG